MKTKSALSFLMFTSCFLLLISCQSMKLEKKLSPDEQEFLSTVRFIITKEERKVFLRLPPSERKAFIKEFWAKRDTEPETEENEYKEEYFSRIDSANRLFRGEGTPGWLTDRGRVYILFGPPHSRHTYPADASGGIIRAREVWYYGNFPLVFIDTYNSGKYTLVTSDLSVLNEINFALRQINKEQEKQLKKGSELIKSTELLLDFELELAESSNIPIILIRVPYQKIWFKEKENMLETALDLSLKILDTAGKIIFQHEEEYPLSISENSLKKNKEKNYEIEIPLILAEGEYSIQATLTNKTGDKSAYKEIKIKV